MSWETDAKYILRMLDDFDRRLKFQERLETPSVIWSSYTPVATFSASVSPSNYNASESYAKYFKLGNLCGMSLYLRYNTAGTAVVGANISLPINTSISTGAIPITCTIVNGATPNLSRGYITPFSDLIQLTCNSVAANRVTVLGFYQLVD